jgi:MarR family transcriptional regulator for hemolysin
MRSDLPLERPVDCPSRRRLPPLLRRAWFSLNQAFRRRIAHLGITPDQFTALRTLLEGDPKGLTQRELAHLMSSDPNTIASLIERMERARLIERGPHERDRRANRIRTLPVGQKKFEKARAVALDLQQEILAALPESRREQFLEDLASVADACRSIAGEKQAPGS